MTYLTPTQRRRLLAIAKDALKQMRYYRVERGSFVHVEDTCLLPAGQQLQLALPLLRKNKTCTVCADGALFLSAVGLWNEYVYRSREELGGASTVELPKLIGLYQTMLIEAAFEKGYGWCSEGEFQDGFPARLDVYQRAVEFGRRYASDRNRLRRILRNIIQHEGEFKP